MLVDQLPERVKTDLMDMFLGELIGSGESRDVYDCCIDDSIVIKLETRPGKFQNIKEWMVWEKVKGTKHEKWFTPCEFISANGRVLIQKKSEVINKKDFPKKVPSFLCDLKYENFGWLNGHIVCNDYGTVGVEEELNGRMIKAEWWKQNDYTNTKK